MRKAKVKEKTQKLLHFVREEFSGKEILGSMKQKGNGDWHLSLNLGHS